MDVDSQLFLGLLGTSGFLVVEIFHTCSLTSVRVLGLVSSFRRSANFTVSAMKLVLGFRGPNVTSLS